MLAELSGHTRTINDIDISPDGTRIATAARDGTARVWTDRGELLQILRGHSGSINRAVFSPDGTRLLTTSNDKTARLWPVDFNEARRMADEAAFRGFTEAERTRFAGLIRDRD